MIETTGFICIGVLLFIAVFALEEKLGEIVKELRRIAGPNEGSK